VCVFETSVLACRACRSRCRHATRRACTRACVCVGCAQAAEYCAASRNDGAEVAETALQLAARGVIANGCDDAAGLVAALAGKGDTASVRLFPPHPLCVCFARARARVCVCVCVHACVRVRSCVCVHASFQHRAPCSWHVLQPKLTRLSLCLLLACLRTDIGMDRAECAGTGCSPF
jgi:hypothetical protein